MRIHARPALAIPGVLFLTAAALAPATARAQQPRFRVYSRLLDPREHPDDARRAVKPPDWSTFGGRTRFTTLRSFTIENGRITGFREKLDKYTLERRLGDVVWPSYPILFAANLEELAREIRRRNLFLFDIWGYVPGSGPGGYWQQFHPPAGVFEMLERVLGERWLGMDVGEQDGRYIGGYAPQMLPASAGRFEQYLNFQRHFERLTTELGGKMATLVSLNFGHYLLKEGIYTLIGAETAQALPNGQVYYAFIRGAGKQYGVPWFGNASVWNRWGHKTYSSKGKDYGPTKGTSLSLLKRLVYSHILYNAMLVGFESGWFDAEGGLSPIGRMQQAAKEWVEQNGSPGVMLTPVALLVDHFAGWSFPRHLYSRSVYRVWGNLPYEPGDHLTHGVLRLLYPGYEDSSYFHDETGFLTATPFGDIADVLLSDAEGWLLARYGLIVAAGELEGGVELRDKLLDYVRGGGRLILTAGNLEKLPGGLGGVRARCGASSNVCELSLPEGATVLESDGGRPLAADVAIGEGRLTVLASRFGVVEEPAVSLPVGSRIDQPLPQPYPLLPYVQRVLEAAFREQMLFEAGEGLSWIVCRRGPGEYTLGLANNGWQERPFKIVSHCGPIREIRELPMDRSERSAVGYLPEGVSGAGLGRNTASTIAGGDMRIFHVRVAEQGVAEIPHALPPPRPADRFLNLRRVASLKEAILRRPTFFHHYGGAVVDWRYLRRSTLDALRQEARWVRQQGLKLLVDLSSGLNLYPDLRLVNNDPPEYRASMEAIREILRKSAALGARGLILTLHRFPENSYTREQSWADFEQTVREICARAVRSDITVYLRLQPGKPPRNVSEAFRFLDRVGAANLRLAPATALLLDDPNATQAVKAAAARIGLWLVAAPDRDLGGARWNAHGRIAGSDYEDAIRKLLAAAPDAPVVIDSLCRTWDEEYLEARALPFR